MRRVFLLLALVLVALFAAVAARASEFDMEDLQMMEAEEDFAADDEEMATLDMLEQFEDEAFFSILAEVEADPSSSSSSSSSDEEASGDADEMVTEIIHKKIQSLRKSVDEKSGQMLDLAAEKKISVIKPLRDNLKAVFMPGGKYTSGHTGTLVEMIKKFKDPKGALTCVVESLARKTTFKCLKVQMEGDKIILSDFKNDQCAKTFFSKVSEKCGHFAEEAGDEEVKKLPIGGAAAERATSTPGSSKAKSSSSEKPTSKAEEKTKPTAADKKPTSTAEEKTKPTAADKKPTSTAEEEKTGAEDKLAAEFAFGADDDEDVDALLASHDEEGLGLDADLDLNADELEEGDLEFTEEGEEEDDEDEDEDEDEGEGEEDEDEDEDDDGEDQE